MRTYHKLSLAKAVKLSSPKPILELSESQIEQLRGYGKILLVVLALSSVLTIAAVMPGALAAIKIFQKLKLGEKSNYQQKTLKITKTFYYLRQKGYIKTFFERGEHRIVLTEKGLRRISELKYEALFIPKPKKWDRKFWQVAADIPTKYRSGADSFRLKVKKLGLFPLQRTLWFYPFDLRNEIDFASRFYRIESYVTVMRVDKLDPADKKTIREYFEEKGLI
ncbi:MAG: hypothetical protein FJZ04_01225 [Candidatus Moranbacteria bacterium]|nr:hypothetical protein [Candidatus Moranbacteria bacterium]